MKNSIRYKMFIFFMTFIAIFMLLSVVLNITLLENYYVFKNRNLLSEQTKIIYDTMSNKGNIQKKIEAIDKMERLSVSIASSDYSIITTSFPKKNSDYRLPKEIEDLIENNNSDEIYEVIRKGDEPKKLAYIMRTPEDKYIIITKQMKGIQESVEISNQFHIIAGLAVFIISSFFIMIFSNRFTKPIVEMSKIADDMSNLIFDKKVKVKNDDELGILGNSINILSDKLNISLNRLKNDIEFQKTLSRNMAHELKTPIGVIKGYSEGILYGVADNPEMKSKYINTIIDECDRMDNLVVEMLELSRLEARDYRLNNIDDFLVSSLMESIILRFRNKIKDENISLVYDTDCKLRLKANYELIDRAVSNLMSNAIKYNNEDKYIEICIEEDENYMKIAVYNTCEEIEDTEFENIFNPFYRLDKARTRLNGGYGLGLSIVKTIAELHYGSISVRNKEKGIEFILKLPKI